jgi:phosphoglycolate phosphatase
MSSNKRKKKLIVFDWDGTLADSTSIIAQCFQNAAVDMGHPKPTWQEANYIIGLGLQEALLATVPDLPPEKYPELANHYRRHFLALEPEIGLFAGAEAMLSALNQAGAWCAVGTGKSRKGLDRTMDKLDVRRHFVFTRCADEGQPKPHPDMLWWLMRQCGVPPEETLMVGDTTHDLNMAAAAGVAAVACTYGAHELELLLTAPHVFAANSISELSDYLHGQL